MFIVLLYVRLLYAILNKRRHARIINAYFCSAGQHNWPFQRYTRLYDIPLQLDHLVDLAILVFADTSSYIVYVSSIFTHIDVLRVTHREEAKTNCKYLNAARA